MTIIRKRRQSRIGRCVPVFWGTRYSPRLQDLKEDTEDFKMKKVVYISKHQHVIIDGSWDCPFFDEYGYCEIHPLINRKAKRKMCDKDENNHIPDWCPLEDA